MKTPAASIRDRRTGKKIDVYAKRGESKQHAIERVTKRHDEQHLSLPKGVAY
jgi:hypothetical protein